VRARKCERAKGWERSARFDDFSVAIAILYRSPVCRGADADAKTELPPAGLPAVIFVRQDSGLLKAQRHENKVFSSLYRTGIGLHGVLAKGASCGRGES
jgi:hypothetical protein